MEKYVQKRLLLHLISVADLGSPICGGTKPKGVGIGLLLPPANEVCEGYVFTRVCLSTGGSASDHAGIPPRLEQNPPSEQAPPRSRHPREQCMLGDTAYKRAVRILLECILVLPIFSKNFMKIKNSKIGPGRGIGGASLLLYPTSANDFCLKNILFLIDI